MKEEIISWRRESETGVVSQKLVEYKIKKNYGEKRKS
jgi:hypothetical protein